MAIMQEYIQYSNENDIEEKDNILCIRILKYTGISILIIISFIIVYNFATSSVMQQKLCLFVLDKLEPIACFFLGLIIKKK